MKLKNKKVIVFGGTSGIGLETIKLILQNGASKVYAISRNPTKVKIKQKQLIIEKADVLDENSASIFWPDPPVPLPRGSPPWAIKSGITLWNFKPS